MQAPPQLGNTCYPSAIFNILFLFLQITNLNLTLPFQCHSTLMALIRDDSLTDFRDTVEKRLRTAMVDSP